jgi:DivIVA domain-containing protein
MKKKDTTGDASDWTSAPAGRRITPLEVQQKEFQVARFGAGYRMREVDEFLDQVTDAMTALVAENERLVRGSSDRGPASTRPSVPATTGDADRAAVEAFLRREKGFLQDLGGLVQEHAEELRSMVRAVRQDASAAAEMAVQESAAKEPPAAARAPDAGSAPEEAPPLAAAAAPDAREEPDAPQAEIVEGSDVSGTTAQATPDAPEDEREDEGEGEDRTTIAGSAPLITGAVADEPILLDEPEPARSGRPDDEEDGSLRELFWGEE